MTRHGDHHARGNYGNPHDLAAMIARQEAPERAAWQQPDRVVRTLGVVAGQTVADVGAGPGYFTRRLARAVGPSGHVYAVDPVPNMLAVLRDRLTEARVHNVTPVLGRGDDPLLPRGRCDLALLVDVYHHFEDGVAFLRRVQRALRPSGRLVNIDFAKRETDVGPPVEHRVAREDFLRDARRAGLTLVTEHAFLPHQYFLVFRRRR
jgi:ubiquinone/menaquinone biosynthesis C-methylase UbiE